MIVRRINRRTPEIGNRLLNLFDLRVAANLETSVLRCNPKAKLPEACVAAAIPDHALRR
jgi:hypothetical protein